MKGSQRQTCTTPNVVFVVASHYQMPSSYIFALTSMSFRDLPLLKDVIGGLLKIVFSRGWFSIRLQFAINVFLRSCTAGWYVVTKGKSLFLLFCFCFSADCLWSKLTSDNDLSISCLGYLRASRRCNLIGSPLMKPLFTPGGWHEVKCVKKKRFQSAYSGFKWIGDQNVLP